MAIEFKNNQFHLKTKNKSYIFSIYKNKYLVHLYWGDILKNNMDLTYFPDTLVYPRATAFHATTEDGNLTYIADLALEFSVTGSGDYRIPTFMAEYQDGSTVSEFEYTEHRIYHGKNELKGLPYTVGDDMTDTLEVTLIDKLTGLKAVLVYSVFEEYDVITRSVRYENTGDEKISILSAQSMSLDFYGQDYKIMHLEGDWGRERYVEYTDVKHGIFSIDSKRGMSSHMNNPFIALMDKNADEKTGNVYGFCLVYSGSFDASMAGSSLGTTRLTMGINPHNFKWELDCNEVFTTPEVIMVHSADGLATMSNMFHKIIRDRILRGKFKRALRPIVINPWDAIGFDINEEILTDIAKTAAEIGIEMFVLDDGWFGNRNDDTSSLGDWTANKSKFKNGLAEFVDKINNFGLKFGLWFEPEMVSPNSDLYRKHPDWCIHAKDRARTENRRQLVLDLTRKEVREYVIDSVSNILDNANIEYVKWDCNRNITETRDQMQTHEYVLGLYEVLETLINKYPHVLFESCSGGGGRFDAGMLYYMPQTWTSDNVVPVTRLYIQYGTSMVYPPVSMTAHIGHLDIGYEKENKYMNTCAMVAMSGNFGYEFDLSKLSKTELEQAKTYAKMYKEIRNTVQYGDFYRLENPYTSDFCSFEFVDEDKAVVFTYQTREKTNGAERRIQLVGLQENEQYECDGHVYYGEELMKLGIRIPLEQYDYASDVRVFNKINTN